MKINIGNHDFSIVWDGVYYKALSNYPRLSDWEIKNIVEFINYEEEHGREVIIESENEELLKEVHEKIKSPDDYKFAKKPELLTECTACNQGGCLTKYLCHVASLDNAKKIISSGKLLSALEVRNVSVDVLVNEDRNAAKDPADYFDYIMFSWGNCQAGDRLVMERKNNRPPTEDDLSVDFTPGVRFYFDYDVLKNNPNSKSDGYHALKIKKELSQEIA